jgi:hypothetical protein
VVAQERRELPVLVAQELKELQVLLEALVLRELQVQVHRVQQVEVTEEELTMNLVLLQPIVTPVLV